MKRITTILIASLICGTSQSVWAQAKEKNISVTIQNDWNQEKKNEPVVIKLNQLNVNFAINSARVWDDNKEIPSQIDDLNRDGDADE